MNIVESFGQRANGPVLVEVSLPLDERLNGGDALPDWKLALERAAGELGIAYELREVERGYAVAFLAESDREKVMAGLQPHWEQFLKVRLAPFATNAFFSADQDAAQAVEQLVSDYGFSFDDFAEHIAQTGRSKRDPRFPPIDGPGTARDRHRQALKERMGQEVRGWRQAQPGQEHAQEFDRSFE